MNIQEFLDDGLPETLLLAIIETKKRFEDTRPHGLKSESDRWVYDNDYYRPILIDEVKKSWHLVTSQPEHECPFTNDRIVHMWICVRKNKYTEARLLEDARTRGRSRSLCVS